MRFVAVELPEEYPFVLALAGTLAFECLLIGFFAPSIARNKVYRDPEVEKKIEALHKQELGIGLKNVKNGFPDMGNGRFSTKEMISYKQWLEINKAQRGHKNFLEQLTIVCLLVLVCGIELPLLSCIFAAIYGIFRCLYFSRNRFIGFIPSNICLSVLALGALYSCYMLITKTSEAV